MAVEELRPPQASFRLKPEATPFVVASAIVQACAAFGVILVSGGPAVGQVAARAPRYTDVYTSNEREKITFVRLTLEWLTEGTAP